MCRMTSSGLTKYQFGHACCIFERHMHSLHKQLLQLILGSSRLRSMLTLLDNFIKLN